MQLLRWFPMLLLVICGISFPGYTQSWSQLNSDAVSLYGEGKTEQAIDLLVKACLVAPDDLSLAESSHNLAFLYKSKGQYRQAVDYYRKAHTIRKEKSGMLSKPFLETNTGLALAYYSMSEFDDALILLEGRDSLYSGVYGEQSQEFLMYMSQIATMYYHVGDYNKAEVWYKKVAAAVAKSYGENNAFYAVAMNSLGLVYLNTGQLEQSEKYLKKGVKLREKLSGTSSPDYGESINNLAVLCMERGDFGQAEEYFIVYLNILQKTSGEATAEFAKAANNLAMLCHKTGRIAESDKYYTIAINTQEKLAAGNPSDLARYLGNYAGLLAEQGDYKRAVPLRKQSLEIIRQKLGEQHPDYTIALNNMASLNFRMKNYDEAAEQMKQVVLLTREKLGESHPTTLKVFYNLASMLARQKKYRESYDIYKPLIKQWQVVYGKRHPDLNSMWQDMGEIHFQFGNRDSAAWYFGKMLQGSHTEISNGFLYLTEREKSQYIEKFRRRIDLYNTFAMAQHQSNAAWLIPSFENEILMRGLLLKSANTFKNMLLASGDTTIIGHYYRWVEVKKKLTELYSSPASDFLEQEIAAYENYSNAYEKALLTFSSDHAAIPLVSFSKITETLESDEAWVLIVRTADQNPRYMAYVVRKKDMFPHVVELCSENELEAVIANTSGGNVSEIIKLYTDTGSTSLFQFIWKPLSHELAGIKKLCLMPAGILHKVNFSAIPAENGKCLADLFELRIPASVPSMGFETGQASVQVKKALVFGGIDYRASQGEREMWTYLDATLAEAGNVSGMLGRNQWEVLQLTGNQASEAAFKKEAETAALIHIATHGFFFPADDIKSTTTVAEVKENQTLAFRGNNAGTMNFMHGSNPLLRSGLVFAGANRVWNETVIQGEDGILTALEVANLDLRNSRVAVLSACETGLGDISGSEGVYGLQRAFKMAGADMLIMSLWPVPDKETEEFMELFYREMLLKNDIRTAFRKSQLEMRKKYNPYYWAAFVLIE